MTVIDGNTFTLNLSIGNGTYTASSATFTAVGLQEAQFFGFAVNVGSERVDRFCLTQYDASDLTGSWTVWFWATIVAAYWLMSRRGNAIPASLEAYYQEATQEMILMKQGTLPIPGVPFRNELAPSWSNVRLDGHYSIRQLRVQRPLSERSPAQFPQKTDLLSDILVEVPVL